MEILSNLLNGTWFVFIIIGIMILTNIVKDRGYFVPLYNFLERKLKNKRLLVFLISAISGILPISGRTIVSAGVLDTIAPKDDRRKIYGIIDYLSTHHYYFWSPIESTVLIPLAGLHITYFQFMLMIYPLLIALICMTLYYIFFVLKESDVVVEKIEYKNENNKKTKMINWVKWDLVFFVGVIIIMGNLLKMYSTEISNFLMAFNGGGIFYAGIICFLISFILGSSGRFAGISAIMTNLFGMAYFPLFFVIGYSGYMLSPMHKCLTIAKNYFGTSTLKFYKIIGIICIVLIAIGYLLI